jgi:hypothetical protein
VVRARKERKMDELISTIVALVVFFGLIILIVVGISLRAKKIAKLRAEKIRLKYADQGIAQKIIDRTIWVGMTGEMLKDAYGEPLKVDQKVMKSKVREVWKYRQLTKTQYGTKITIENNVVTSWDIK